LIQDTAAAVIDEPGTLTLTIRRFEGSFGSVTVTWEVREVVSGAIASQDFNPAIGYVFFEENERMQSFNVTTWDETIPELDEDFVVVLTAAVSNDNQTSSTPSSGASINSTQFQSSLTVLENDFPYGVLQFTPSPPVPGQPVALAEAMPTMSVQESAGMVTVYVVRAQGREGNVSIEYFTSDGTATSVGLDPDYVSTAGQLSFASGQTVQTFQLTLVDDSVPELRRTFYVNLTTPQGGD